MVQTFHLLVFLQFKPELTRPLAHRCESTPSPYSYPFTAQPAGGNVPHAASNKAIDPSLSRVFQFASKSVCSSLGRLMRPWSNSIDFISEGIHCSRSSPRRQDWVGMDFLQQVKEAQTIIVFYYFLALKNTARWITFLSTTQYGARPPDRSFFLHVVPSPLAYVQTISIVQEPLRANVHFNI